MTFTQGQDRSVVVTGGARGIGPGIAEPFARQGAAVLLTGRDAGTARTVADDLARRTDGRVAGMAVDMRQPEQSELMVAEAERRDGGVDVLCANAGIFPERPPREMTADDVDEVLEVNPRGSILSVRACPPWSGPAAAGSS
nr:SDR family NAD(P)-dependent oxidoreductase [Streptomyces buecherae]